MKSFYFFLVKVNVRVRVRVRVSIRVRMRVRVSIRVRMRVRNGQFLNWSITALGVKGPCAASASSRPCTRLTWTRSRGRVGPWDDESGAVDPVASPFLKAMNIEQT